MSTVDLIPAIHLNAPGYECELPVNPPRGWIYIRAPPYYMYTSHFDAHTLPHGGRISAHSSAWFAVQSLAANRPRDAKDGWMTWKRTVWWMDGRGGWGWVDGGGGQLLL